VRKTSGVHSERGAAPLIKFPLQTKQLSIKLIHGLERVAAKQTGEVNL
jgi:hypothetical protein